MRLEEMKRSDVPAVLALADECVGKGLYRIDDFLSVFDDEDKGVYVLKDDSGFVQGYIYFFVTTTSLIEASLSLKEGTLGRPMRVGRIQSVALREEYRGKRLSEYMIRMAFAIFLEKRICTIYILCWKPGGVLPLSKALEKCGFEYVMTIENAWYDNEALYCPYCMGRCHCSAALYTRKLIEDYK